MWHIKKQRWFKGPSLPIKTCSLESSAVSLNQTDVLLFIGPFFNNYIVEGNGGQDWVNGVSKYYISHIVHFPGFHKMTVSLILDKGMFKIGLIHVLRCQHLVIF